jgi:hypothetical protein
MRGFGTDHDRRDRTILRREQQQDDGRQAQTGYYESYDKPPPGPDYLPAVGETDHCVFVLGYRLG